MTTAHEAPIAFNHSHIRIHDINGSDLRWALARGWEDFTAKRGDIVILGLLYPVLGLLLAVTALNYALFPVLFPLTAGLTLLGPAVASGFYELARRRERGLDARWRHFFDVFIGPNFGSIGALTLFLTLIFALWMAVAWAIYGATLARFEPASFGQFLSLLFSTSEGWTMIIGGNLAGLTFAIAVLTISAVSFPMMVDQQVDAETAVETSMRAMGHNPVTMAKWGLIVAALLAIGSIPLFVGLAVILPWLGYATWHLYTRVVSMNDEERRS